MMKLNITTMMFQLLFGFQLLSLPLPILGFVVPTTSYGSPRCRTIDSFQRIVSRIAAESSSSSSSNGNDESSNDWLESQRRGYQTILNKIDTVEANIQNENVTTTTDDSSTSIVLELQELAVIQVEKDLKQLMARLVPPVGLSMEEYIQTIQLILRLPPVIRVGLTKALDMDDSVAGDVRRIPELATRLYEERVTLTPQRLSDAFKAAQMRTTTTSGTPLPFGSKDKPAADKKLASFFEKDPNEPSLEETYWKQMMSRVCRKEGMEPTAKDVDILLGILDDDTTLFRRTTKTAEPVPGGFVLRGQNCKSSGGQLIEALDAKLPKDWSCTVSYMPDITASSEGEASSTDSNILVLLNKDFSPETSPWFNRLASSLAITSAVLFAVGVYGSNGDAITKQIMDMTSPADLNGLEWFNGKIGEVLFPLFIILASHELGHILVAKRDKIEIESTLPTLMPTWSNLPLLGGLTRIRTSPQNMVSLFDFAFIGPLLGFISSFICFGVGLLATQSVLATSGGAGTVKAASELLPALPVSLIKQSTLLGTLVDSFFGGDGYITLQDPVTPVPLHPYAIAGFCGILINAVEMLPLGATDGGRISQALFGRQGHSIVGATMWTLLLIANFTLEGNRGDTLVTAWVIYNVVQNDMEIPARDETDDVDLARSLTAFGMWFLTALILIPME